MSTFLIQLHWKIHNSKIIEVHTYIMLWLWRTKLFQKNILKFGTKLITNRWAWELELSKGGGGPEKIRHSRAVPWQPWEWEPAWNKQPPTTASHWSTPMMSGKGCALNSQNQTPKQWSSKISRASNCKYDNQSSDPYRAVIHKDQQRRELQI